jgi:hypothetical protein
VLQTITHSSVRERYSNAKSFPKFGIFRGAGYGIYEYTKWIVVGPGLLWLGEETNSFEEALEFVSDRIRQYGATK